MNHRGDINPLKWYTWPSFVKVAEGVFLDRPNLTALMHVKILDADAQAANLDEVADRALAAHAAGRTSGL